MLRFALVSLVILALLTTPTAAADNDAGTGGDAPNSRSLALPVTTGTLAGRVADNDVDWYRIAVPSGMGLLVEYSASVPDTWNNVEMYEESGPMLTAIDAGETGRLAPTAGHVILQIDGFWDDMEYTLELAFFAAAIQNDAGLGKDASNLADRPSPLAWGRVSGHVDKVEGDPADWYRVEFASDEVVTFTTESSFSLGIYSSQGNYLGSVGDYWNGPVRSFIREDGILLVEVGYSYEDTYEFRVEREKRADLAAAALSVASVPLETEWGPTPLTARREVSVTVANAGPGPSRAATLVVLTEQAGVNTAPRVLATLALALAPGESASFTVPWDTTGQVGDVRVRAIVSNEHDLESSNDERAISTYTIAGGSGYGVDLLNQRVSDEIETYPCSCKELVFDLGVSHDVHGTGPHAYLGLPLITSSVELNAGTNATGGLVLDPRLYVLGNWILT